MIITLEAVRRALGLVDFDATSAQLRMAPQPRPFVRGEREGQPRLAAVLILLYPFQDQLCFALMRRNEYPGVHSGQISLPGGSSEPGETWVQTALRETSEEFGVCDPVEILGYLTPIYVPPSDFEIHPVVGTLPNRPQWIPDPREVAAILEVPLADILNDANKTVGNWTLRSGIEGMVPYYALSSSVVWGATAIILSEFEWRLRTVLTAEQNP